MRNPNERIQELLETSNRYLERARLAERERDQWRDVAGSTQESLQRIGEEFGVLGGEPRTVGIERVLKELRQQRDDARQIVRDIFWMALRYADGRKSYAVAQCNDAVRKGYDAGWLEATEQDGVTPRFARDGMAEDGVDF